MFINCICGARIHDNTDYQSDKGYLIPDQSYEKYRDALGSGVRREHMQYEKTIYQCYACSRIFIPDDANAAFATFFPEENYAFGALSAEWDAQRGPECFPTWYAAPPLGRWYQIKLGNFFRLRATPLSNAYVSPVTNASPQASVSTANQRWAWR